MVEFFRAGERRFGKPRTEVERKKRHKKEHPGTVLPPRGTGLTPVEQHTLGHLVEVYAKDKQLAGLEAAAAGIPISRVAFQFGLRQGYAAPVEEVT